MLNVFCIDLLSIIMKIRGETMKIKDDRELSIRGENIQRVYDY